MDKLRNKTILTVALATTVICGLPGCFLLTSGLSGFFDIFGAGASPGSFTDVLLDALLSSGLWVCLGAALTLVPLILILITVFQRRRPKPEETPEKTFFEDEPLPPPS